MGEPASTVTILRTQPAQRDLIDRAARLSGRSRAEFMLEASCEKAEGLLLDQTLFVVDARAYKASEALLHAHLECNVAVQRLLARPAPWEK